MRKVELVNTYMYEDFVSESEGEFLKNWILENEQYLVPNQIGPYRKFKRLHKLEEEVGGVPQLFDDLKEKIIELEGLEDIMIPLHNPMYASDWIGVQWDNAFVEEHVDGNGPDDRFYTRRYNLLVSLPNEGGLPIYGGEILDIKERSLWMCEAGLVKHSSTPNVGSRPRINVSFAFTLPIR